METSTKILLLTAMYGLPVCFVIIYRIKENLKMKRSRIGGRINNDGNHPVE